MLTNEIWLRKTIVYLKSVLLIHRKLSPFPAREGIDKSQFCFQILIYRGEIVYVNKGNSLRHFPRKMPPPSAEGG